MSAVVVGNGPYQNPPGDPPQPGQQWDSWNGRWVTPAQGISTIGGNPLGYQGPTGGDPGGTDAGGSYVMPDDMVNPAGRQDGSQPPDGWQPTFAPPPTVPETDQPDLTPPSDEPPDWFKPFKDYADSVANSPLDFSALDTQKATQEDFTSPETP